MQAPDPLVIAWQGRQLRVRHLDPHLGPYTPRGTVIRSAVELANDVDGLRLVLASALGDRYRVRVAADGSGLVATCGRTNPPALPCHRGAVAVGIRGRTLPLPSIIGL